MKLVRPLSHSKTMPHETAEAAVEADEAGEVALRPLRNPVRRTPRSSRSNLEAHAQRLSPRQRRLKQLMICPRRNPRGLSRD